MFAQLCHQLALYRSLSNDTPVERDWLPSTGALGCFLELQGVKRELLVKGYAVWPDVFARIFLGMRENGL